MLISCHTNICQSEKIVQKSTMALAVEKSLQVARMQMSTSCFTERFGHSFEAIWVYKHVP